MIKNTLLFLITCALLSACNENQNYIRPQKPLNISEIRGVKLQKEFLLNNVHISSGIGKTGVATVVNPVNGNKVKPCSDSTIIEKKDDMYSDVQQENAKSKEKDCGVTIVDPSPDLINAINASKSIIKGTIRNENGEEVSANFVVEVTGVYQGSNCTLKIVAGKKYSICYDSSVNCPQDFADALKALLKSGFPEPVARQLAKAGLASDCDVTKL